MPEPRFHHFSHCTLDRVSGWFRSYVTGWWVCGKCGCPTEAWWRDHKRTLDRLARRGLSTVDADNVTWKKRRSPAMVEAMSALGEPVKHTVDYAT